MGTRLLTTIVLFSIFFAACSQGGSTDENGTKHIVTDTIKVSGKKADLGPREEVVLTDEEKDRYRSQGIDVDRGIPTGLKLGDMAPVFKQKNQKGEDIFLPDLCKQGPVVLQFYRGQWCPVCNRYLAAFQDSLKLIEKAGATVLLVTPETLANAQKTIENTGIKTHVISDANGLLMNAFRVSFYVTPEYQQKIKDKLVTDIAVNNGSKDAKLPVPATYLIDTKGKVRWKQFDVDYHNRASVAEILQAIEALP